MCFFQKLAAIFRNPSFETPKAVATENSPKVTIDKVSNFNRIAPPLFAEKLKEYGYELEVMNTSEPFKGISWSTHHIYLNKALNLKLDIQQAPYYTDYGFSIFIINPAKQEIKLICNVPHELHDAENRFLINIVDKFFANDEVMSLLRGEVWKTISCVRYD